MIDHLFELVTAGRGRDGIAGGGNSWTLLMIRAAQRGEPFRKAALDAVSLLLDKLVEMFPELPADLVNVGGNPYHSLVSFEC